MLEYVKEVLSKVSFSRNLFEKELSKSLKNLVPEDIQSLKDWCIINFSDTYLEEIERIFNNFNF